MIQLGSMGSINLEYYHKEKPDYAVYMSSALFTPTLVFLFLCIVALIISPWASDILMIPSDWVFIIPVVAYAKVFFEITLKFFRNREQPGNYVILAVSRVVVELLLSLYLVIQLTMSWEGRLLGIIITSILAAVVCFYVLYNTGYFRFRLKKSYVRAALLFGIPLVPYAISKYVVTYSDRIFIANMVADGTAAVGIYSVGYTFGKLLSMVNQGFVIAFTPFIYKSLKEITPRKEDRIVRYSYGFIGFLFVVLLGLTAITPFIFDNVIDDAFASGAQYVFWVGLGYVFFAAYLIFSNFVFYYKRTKLLAYLAAVNIAINIVLNYFFIMEFGAIGAAYATAISYFCVLVMIYFIVERIHPLPWFKFGRVFRRKSKG